LGLEAAGDKGQNGDGLGEFRQKGAEGEHSLFLGGLQSWPPKVSALGSPSGSPVMGERERQE
jgi:hypothetical protein